MTIEEIKEKKLQTTRDIKELLLVFKKETGLNIEQVQLRYDEYITGEVVLSGINLKLEEV